MGTITSTLILVAILSIPASLTLIILACYLSRTDNNGHSNSLPKVPSPPTAGHATGETPGQS